MAALKSLESAIEEFSEVISNFPLGAISLEDLKPVGERIRNQKETLQSLNAKVLELKAYQSYEESQDDIKEDVEDTVSNLHEATANALINNSAIKLSVHSFTIQKILAGEEGDQKIQKKIYACMQKLYSLNGSILSMQKEIEKALQKQLDLKIECQSSLFEYKNYLKEQEEVYKRKLDEINPEIANDKKVVKRLLTKANIIKKLIVNLIAASYEFLLENPILLEMLEKHRELITIEAITKMVENKKQSTENGNTEDRPLTLHSP